MRHSELDKLINLLSRLPGLGPRSARRLVLHLLKYRETLMFPLAQTIAKTAEQIKNCQVCGNIDVISPCSICNDHGRHSKIICVVETIADLWAMERSKVFKGKYHVLGGTLSAMDGRKPEDLHIEKLIYNIKEQGIEEVVIATNATVEGQTTAFYLSEKLTPLGIKISRLAYGLPVGSELDYLDESTLTIALESRKLFADN